LDRHDDSNLLDFFRSRPEWTVDSKDGEAVIFVHANPARMHDGIQIAA
jgi:hypothetical protein